MELSNCAARCLRRHPLLGSLALAFTLPLLSAGPASAQANCSQPGTNCALAQDQYQYLQSFANLPNTAAGQALLNNSLSTLVGIYQNATTAQRNQAALNALSDSPYVQAHIWGMISGLPLTTSSPSTVTTSTLAFNASSFQNGSAGAAFVPFAGGVASGANLATAMAANNPAGLNSTLASLISNIWGNVTQVEAMKYSFTSYNTGIGLGSATAFATYPYYGQSYNPGTFPASQDLRPYQLSSAIANSPWSSLPASQQPWAWAQNSQWLPGSAQTALATEWGSNEQSPSFPSGHSTLGNITSVLYAMMVPQAYQSLMVSALEFGLSRNILGVHHPLDIIGGRILAYYSMTQLMAGNPLYANTANGTANFASTISSYASQINGALGSLAAVPYAQCAGTSLAGCIGNGTFPAASQLTAANQAYVNIATYGLQGPIPTNSTNTAPANSNLLIASRFPYLSSQQQLDVLTSTLMPAGVPLDDGSGWARLNLYAGAGGYGAFNNGMVTVNMSAAAGGFSAFDFWSNNIGGTGGLTLTGSGTLVLGGNNTYTGGTVVGCAQGNCTPTLGLSGTLGGNLTIYPNATFVSGGGYMVSPTSTLSNAGTFQSVNSVLSNFGTLNNNGTMVSSVANYGLASGVGSVTGTFANYGVLSPGSAGSNSIGTFNVTGTLVNAGGTYQAEVNGTNQNDQISVNGTATLQGGSVYVFATPGTVYGPTQTYKIVSTTGGLTGTFASVNELYPFLLSSLSYDANNAYLTLQIGGFAAAAATQTQYAVGAVLDANVGNASGDFATVLSSLAVNVTSNAQAQAVLQSLSGNNYAGFSSYMVQGAQLFMDNFASQTGGGGSPLNRAPGSNRVAMAEACDVACDTISPPKWGAWGGGLGGLGTVGAGQPVGSVTYNAGGFAAGLDRLVTDNVRVGVTAGYMAGTQWVSGFSGTGRSDTFQTGLYAGFAQDKVYADALLGYAYTWNQMWRPLSIPGLQPRTALGQTGANQFFGQLETGYRFDIGTAAEAFVTPFARLQAYTGSQNAFTETGAQSLNLTVAQQTTNSLRTVLGAQVGGAMDLGWREKLAMQLRLGWSHEYADVGRPVSATLAGAPAMPFTTWGVSPQRDGAVIGLSANTAVAEAMSVYVRYEGLISGQDNAHAFTAGLRMTW
jgi:autotransporter-associated beta strand protein